MNAETPYSGLGPTLTSRPTGGTVLLVEDEESIGTLLRTYLERDGYRVVWVRTGEEALAEITRHAVRILVLDIGLPGMDGFEVCPAIRRRSPVPILMLTARDEEPDRVAGLGLGPTTTYRSLSRRARARGQDQGDPSPGGACPREHVLELADVVVDVDGREVAVAGDTVELTAKEFDLLAYFLESPGVVPRGIAFSTGSGA